MENGTLPHIPGLGLRTIKTGVAVLVCLILYSFIGRTGLIYAVISAVVCMGMSVETSIESGKGRLIGTAIGGVIGIVIMHIAALVPYLYVNYIIIALAVVATIFICNMLHTPGAAAIAAIVLLIIVLTVGNEDKTIYAINRIVDTAIGVVVSVVINWALSVPVDYYRRRKQAALERHGATAEPAEQSKPTMEQEDRGEAAECQKEETLGSQEQVNEMPEEPNEANEASKEPDEAIEAPEKPEQSQQGGTP